MQHARNRGFVVTGHFPGFVEFTIRQQRLHLFPDNLVLVGYSGQRDVTLDGDSDTDCEHQQDRIHEHATRSEEAHKRIEKVHLQFLI